MNKKRTNFFVAILNTIAIISLYILYFTKDFLNKNIISGPEGIKSIYGSIIIDVIMGNIVLILILICSLIGVLNIICAIQNRKNKKISFWQLIFGIYEIFMAILFSIDPIITDLKLNIIIGYAVIPIVLALINIILIKKNKPKPIQIISYILAIIISILVILNSEIIYWDIICIIMQFIYIHFQEKNIQESKTRKIVNIILYYILQAIVVISFMAIIIVTIIISIVNYNKINSQVIEILNNMGNLTEITNEEPYMVVENNLKYGFINENGEEKIPCEYDGVSYFHSTDINNQKYYFALAKKGNDYYIISKGNEQLNISNNEYFRNISKYVEQEMIAKYSDQDLQLVTEQSYSFALQILIKQKANVVIQSMPEKILTYEKNLQRDNSGFYNDDNLYYKAENYTMVIESVKNDNPIYTLNDDYFIETNPTYNITIKKNNGEESSSIECLPGFNKYSNNIETLNDGSIVFKNPDEEIYGWYDNNGDMNYLPTGYEIENIIDNIIIISRYNEESMITEYYFIDQSGQILLKSYDVLVILENTYVVQNENNKMILYGTDLNKISNEYDLIAFMS